MARWGNAYIYRERVEVSKDITVVLPESLLKNIKAVAGEDLVCRVSDDGNYIIVCKTK
jgi:antitoxin component of MazEF toxin-antitoxin module